MSHASGALILLLGQQTGPALDGRCSVANGTADAEGSVAHLQDAPHPVHGRDGDDRDRRRVPYAVTISRRDVRGLATIHRLLERVRAGPASIGAFISGVVFGLLTAATGGVDFLDGWLIAAYVLVVLFLITTTLFLRGALKLGRAAVEAEAGTRSVDDVARWLSVGRCRCF